MISEQLGKTSESWFALRVKSRAEKAVATMAHNRGVEEFLPVYESRHQWSDRNKTVELPLFPGYVFCRFNVNDRLPLLTIPGVLHIVGLGRAPLPVDDAEIVALQTASSCGLTAEPHPFLRIGERVRVHRGPMAGVEGLLVQIRKGYRVVLSVTMLNQSVAVEVEREWVTPADGLAKPVRPIHFKTFDPRKAAFSNVEHAFGTNAPALRVS